MMIIFSNFIHFLKKVQFLNPLKYIVKFYFLCKSTNISSKFAIFKESITIKNISKYIIILYILSYIIFFILQNYSYFSNPDLFSYVIPNGDKNDSIPMDPVRWWPSGVPQGWGVVGTGIGVFAALSKVPGVSPRARLLGALAGAGVSASQITYHSALENSVGFNRMMGGLTEYRRTGVWPSIDRMNTVDSKILDEVVNNAAKSVDTNKVDNMVKEITEKSNNFLPNSNSNISDFISHLTDLLFKNTMQFVQPVPVQGYFDDLIGQRIFIEVSLLIMALSVTLLFIVFIFNILFLLNKDKIINKFDNKFITFYVKYQAFFSRLSLIWIPILIISGLFTITHGLH